MIDSIGCKSELRRLEHGPAQGEPIPGVGIVQFAVKCKGDAYAVLSTAASVMRVICSECEKGWTEQANWRSLLPSHFVTACAEEMTKQEAELWLQRWQTLRQDERDAEERTRKWSLANWLYWLQPTERVWQWWDAKVVDGENAVVSVAVESWPFGWGALTWLFRGSGAVEVVALQQTADR